LLVHMFDREGHHHEYQTAHLVEFRDGKIKRWTEHPGSMQEFETAWGPPEATPGAASRVG
jgi:hypothetical protein